MVIKLELQVIFPHFHVGLILSNITSFLEVLVGGTKYIHSLKISLLHILGNIYYSCPVPHSVYNICNPYSLELIAMLRLGLSHVHS